MDTFGAYLDGWYDVEIQLQMHLYNRSEEAFRQGNTRKDQIATIEQFEQWRSYVRETFLAGIGGLPEMNCPLEPNFRGELQGAGFTIHKLLYQSLPDWYVTANLYMPDELDSPAAAVLFVCGHAQEAKGYSYYQRVCQRLAKNGLVVLAIDPLGQGERFQYFDGQGGAQLIGCSTEEHCYEGIQCWWLGQSLARYFLHDAMRGVGLLESLPEVDSERIGITGNSGGWTQSTMMMLADPRLAAAAPCTVIMHRHDYLWTGQAQDAEQIYPGTTAAGIDHDDYLAIMAPKPVLVGAVAYDFFPLEGTIYSVERARRIYGLFDREDNLKLEVDLSEHEYTDNLARATTEWFCRHLQGKPPPEVDRCEPQAFPAKQLWCTKSGQLLGDEPTATTVWHLNRAEHEKKLTTQPGGTARIEALRAWLREQVEQGRQPVEFHPRIYGATYDGDVRTEKYWWWSERDIINAAIHFRSHPPQDNPPLIIALLANGTQDIPAHENFIRQRCRSGEELLVLDVRGWGALLPRKIQPADRDWYGGVHYKLLCEAIFLGDSLCAMRLYDVLRAIEFTRVQFAPPEIVIHADPGPTAVYAMLAALLDDSVKLELPGGVPEVDELVEDRFYRYQEGVHSILPGLLARCTAADLTEAVKAQLLTFAYEKGFV